MRRALVFLVMLLLLSNAAQASFVFTDDAEVDGVDVADGADATGDVADSTPVDEGGIVFSDGSSEEDTSAVGTDAMDVGDQPVEILLTAAGDVTIGGNMRKNPKSNMYTKIIDMAEEAGLDLSFFFANVQDYFGTDDLTLVNFEGTLTEATKHRDHTFTFRAPPEHVEMLTLGSVEAVSFENNHAMDFYETGYNDTIRMFEEKGIIYSTEAHPGVFEKDGVSVAMLSYQTFDGAYPRLSEQVPLDIAEAKQQYDIVIVSYHWGDEAVYTVKESQITLGRATIDAGADLVLGHHSHRVAPIEQYNGKYIVYSLGNCSFSGNSQPDNMDTFLFQLKFIVQDETVTIGDMRIVPCSISSVTGVSGAKSGQNDLMVTPFEAGSDAAKRVVQTMLDNSDGLDYALTSYPTEWPNS